MANLVVFVMFNNIMHDVMWQIVCGVPNNLENGQDNFFNINAQI